MLIDLFYSLKQHCINCRIMTTQTLCRSCERKRKFSSTSTNSGICLIFAAWLVAIVAGHEALAAEVPERLDCACELYVDAAIEEKDSEVARGNESPLVDEPLGARYSLGMTLWHMGHNAGMVEKFHDYLKTQGLTPEKLLDASALIPPKTVTRLLLEPERLSQDQLSGWTVDQESIVSSATDAGPTVSLPLRVPEPGLYRIWIQYYGNPNARGVTSLRIYREGLESQGPIAQADEFYDQPAEKSGPQWHDMLIDLPAGNLVVKLGHVTRWWHGAGGYDVRRVDCLYLTNEWWAKPPDEESRKVMRQSSSASGSQWTLTPELNPIDLASWRWWQVRPLSWEDAAKYPKLFALSREFWTQQIEALAKLEYEEGNVPDYRRPERQVIYDETWNIVANPVRIARQINTLTADVRKESIGYNYVWHDVGGNIEGLREDGNYKDTPLASYGNWYGGPGRLEASYGNPQGTVTTKVPVSKPGRYAMWVLSNSTNLNYTAPWFGKVSAGGREPFTYHHQGNIPTVWMKMGEVSVEKPGDVTVDFVLDGSGNGGTYRRIYTLFLVDDPNITPTGTVHPPWTMDQFRARAAELGASPSDRMMLWMTDNAYRPLSQDVWADRITVGDSWPNSPQQAKARSKEMLVAGETCQAVQIALRNLTDQPINFKVIPGPLVGQGGSFPKAVTWRAEAFVPYGPDRQAWTPFFLMRRPSLTIPPLNVAGVWLTLDTHGVPPGEYESQIRYQADGIPEQIITLKVRVSSIKPTPRRPVLVDGWTQPHEGEAYLRDFVEHGMNVWPGEMSKGEMKKRGIRLLRLSWGSSDEKAAAEAVARWKSLGLEYDDYFVGIMDEPGGTTEEALKGYIDAAKVLRAVDPKVRICFNPSEAAQLATFQILAPYCDAWTPYSLHVFSPYYNNPEKKKIYQGKPWMWYTTPCLWDKTAREPGIRLVPSQSGNCVGVAFFALNYPWRDQWDTGYEHIADASTMGAVMSCNGPVATIVWEQMREAVQTANLAMMVREQLGVSSFDDVKEEELRKLIAEGSSEQLIEWLELNSENR
ncbi:MAG: hypothetical protein RLY14_172 [Planctomycetota bacterium]|jgi:hypothetical protein